MASRSTVKRQKSAQKVIAAGRTHRQRIADEAARVYGEEMSPAVELFVTKVIADLSAKVDAMVAADDAHITELRDDPSVRTRRDELAESLRNKLIVAREQLEAICGAEYVARLGFNGKTPVDPVAIQRLARVIVENLNSIEAPEPRLPGYQLDTQTWCAPLAELVSNLEDSVTRVANEERQAEATMTAKHSAIDKYDESFSRTAKLISSLLEMAGEKELATRVRPSQRRSGQTAEMTGEAVPAS